MWAHGFAIIAAPLQQEFGLKDSEVSRMFTSFAVGLTSGAFVWGLLVDLIGRKWCFNLTCLISSGFGLVLPVFGNFDAIVFFAAMIGTGVGGNIPVDATITLEWVRGFFSCFWPSTGGLWLEMRGFHRSPTSRLSVDAGWVFFFFFFWKIIF